MDTRMTRLAALIAAGGATLAITAAPSALAGPGLLPECERTEAGGGAQGGGTTLCETPGNAQLDSRPSVYAGGGIGGGAGIGRI